MKKIILFSIIIATIFSNCTEEETNYAAEGIITGPNPMACPTSCCSGWFIEIANESFHFLDFPSGSNFNSDDIDSYPFSVQLDFEASGECWDNSIEISAIEPL